MKIVLNRLRTKLKGKVMTDNELAIAQKLYAEGYRQVSRKHCLIARVDIPDSDMIQKFIDDNFGNSTSGVPSLSLESQREHYRRVCSKDSKTVTLTVLNYMRNM